MTRRTQILGSSWLRLSKVKRPIAMLLASFWVLPVGLPVTAYAADIELAHSDSNQTYPTQVYWGDTHVHTSFSTEDANLSGMNEMDPAAAYKFARGESIITGNGALAKLLRPLDFLVVADHAYNIGVAYSLQTDDPEFINTALGERLKLMYEDVQANPEAIDTRRDFATKIKRYMVDLPLRYRKTTWQRVVENAEAYNEPGRFTTFAGYEWTSSGAEPSVVGNLHRVVIYRDGPQHTLQVLPFSVFDSRNPKKLWQYLANYEESTGGQVLAIPHNGNVSNGEMFALTNFDGQPLSATYAKLRREFEPLFEVTQMKGDSEAHPLLSPDDEFADFETWNSRAGTTQDPDTAQRVSRKRGEYARPALKRGLSLQAKLGQNPYKFGLIGSTDTHTSLATADEDNFWGEYTSSSPSAERITNHATEGSAQPLNWESAAGGYAGVWATDNTREAIFTAMERKEVFATSGPRMSLRFFGGWNFKQKQVLDEDFVSIGYTQGVPMGGDLPCCSGRGEGRTPTFMIRVQKDPMGANLDRVQVIKGWRNKEGEVLEKVYNVAAAEGRRIRGRRVKPLPSTVDVTKATYENSIGAAELAVVWRDPDFNRNEHAFWYVRALEIETPRWTAHDVKTFGLEKLDSDIPMVTQERVYSSPIWYTPQR